MGVDVDQVQKYLIIFCTYLNEHVENWRSVLQGTAPTVVALSNQAEQLRYVERAHLNDMEGFEKAQNAIQFSIVNGIEDEIAVLKTNIERLNKANQTLKNKLTTLEKSSLDLDWEEDNFLMKGTATQPPLDRILIGGLEFWQFFNKSFRNINTNFKNIDLKCEKFMSAFERSFNVDLEEKCITDYLAITQYVDNAKAIT